MADRDLDLILFGATSFVGRITSRHLAARADPALRWAIAGRDPTKLAEVAVATGADVEQIVADAEDPAAVRSLASRARVVVSTVGPYVRYGSPLVAAVAASGTQYCDLTGEPQWVRTMIDAHHEEAVGSGARVVHACGFDSIPSDLGVLFTQRQAIARFGEPCTSIAMRVTTLKGGASGGTIASMMDVVTAARSDPAAREVLRNPYALAPAGQRSGPPQPNVLGPTLDRAGGGWVGPFVMAVPNTRIVHRTHALLGRPWGDGFEYDEAMALGDGPGGAVKATALTGGIAYFAALAAAGPTRSLLRRVLPQPGEGPSPEQQEAGCFDIHFIGTTASGGRIDARVTGDRDPGYGSTAPMLTESALALLDPPPTDALPAGVLTPATAFGAAMIDRLSDHAGMTFTVVDAT